MINHLSLSDTKYKLSSTSTVINHHSHVISYSVRNCSHSQLSVMQQSSESLNQSSATITHYHQFIIDHRQLLQIINRHCRQFDNTVQQPFILTLNLKHDSSVLFNAKFNGVIHFCSARPVLMLLAFKYLKMQ